MNKKDLSQTKTKQNKINNGCDGASGCPTGTAKLNVIRVDFNNRKMEPLVTQPKKVTNSFNTDVTCEPFETSKSLLKFETWNLISSFPIQYIFKASWWMKTLQSALVTANLQ